MKKRDYFHILGVRRSESTEGIKSAFRKLAKKCHPDRSGAEGTRFFQDITEAYSVLVHPESRREYMEKLLAEERAERRRGAGAREIRPAEHPGGERAEIDPAGVRRFTRGVFRGSLAEFFFDLGWNFDDSGLFGFEGDAPAFRAGFQRYVPAMDLELILSPEEAARGGVLPADIAIPSSCRVCFGFGGMGAYACPSCGGRGVTRTLVPSSITIPAGVESGAILQHSVSMPHENVLVRIHVQVRQH